MKRGRPRQNRPAIDHGPPEQIKRRMMISPDDPTKSSCPLDALLARGKISPQAHSAAALFRSYHHRVFGSPHPIAMDPTMVTGPDYTGDLYEAEWKYRDACKALQQCSRGHFDAIDNIVVHERWPHWFLMARGRYKAMSRDLEAFGILIAWERSYAKAA